MEVLLSASKWQKTRKVSLAGFRKDLSAKLWNREELISCDRRSRRCVNIVIQGSSVNLITSILHECYYYKNVCIE